MLVLEVGFARVRWEFWFEVLHFVLCCRDPMVVSVLVDDFELEIASGLWKCILASRWHLTAQRLAALRPASQPLYYPKNDRR